MRVSRLPHAEGLDLPAYRTAGAAGLDLLAALAPGESIVLEPGARERVPTGLCLALPEGYEAQVRPRSGLALRYGVTVLNSPGTVDADYRGEVGVVLVNLGAEPFRIERGDRIAQLVLARVERLAWEEGPLDGTARGAGGFGSTGHLAAPPTDAAAGGALGMNLLPERSLLAVATVVDIALNARMAPVSAKALSMRHGLQPRHLETLLQELVRAGVLKGTRGPRGGYALARERRRITVGEILRTAARVGEADAKPRPRPSFVDAVVVPALRPAGDAFLAALDGTTVAELCARAEAGDRASGARDAGIDFTI